jgi:hypothetical protein
MLYDLVLLQISVSVSLPLIEAPVESAKSLFAAEACGCTIIFAAVIAALYFGYALFLRPDDYLHPIAKNFHRIRESNIVFWFVGMVNPIRASDSIFLPPKGNRPLRLSILPDSDKANPLARMGMRACAWNPDRSSFCFITYLLDFFRELPSVGPYNAIFAGIPENIHLYKFVRQTMEVTAPRLGIKISQLLPRGLRGGASAQIAAYDGTEKDMQRTSGWRGKS